MVPALLAIGHDLARNVRAARRALAAKGRAPGTGLAIAVAAVGMAVAFAFTMGSVLMTGTLPSFLGGGGSLPLAFGLYVAASAVVALIVWLVAALRFAAARRAAP